MNRLTLLLVVLWSFLPAVLLAQNLEFQWAHAFGGPQSDPPSDVGVDSEGNLYFVGGFSGSADFDPGPDTYTLTSAGALDIFIAKYSSEGEFIWAKQIGDYASENADNIIISSNDELYISGSFDGISDFDPGSGVSTLSTNGWRDIFLLKMNLDGDFIWAKSIGGSDIDLVQGITLDNDNQPIITGYFIGAVDFNPNGSPLLFNAEGYNDVFVSKFSSNGNMLWSKHFNGSGSAFSKGVACDADNNVYFTGYFTESMDCNPGMNSNIITSNGLNDVYLVKLNEDGDFIWAKSYGAWSEDRAFAIEFTTDNRFYVAGYYRGDVDFDPNDDELTISSANGSEDYFIQQFNTEGELLWAHGFGGSQSDQLSSIATDIFNNVYLAASAASIFDADPSENEDLISNVAPFEKNAILHKLSAEGDHLWAVSIGGGEEDYGRGVFVDQDRNVYFSGQFESTADLNPFEGVQEFSSSAFADLFVLKLAQCQAHSEAQVVSTCDASYTWINGITYTSNQDSLSYLSLGVAEGQCDSLYTLNLTFIELDNSISTGENSISANQAGASYQWYNCGSDMLPIEGATEQSFFPSETGSYLVEISIDGCTSSSECVFITVVSSGEELTQTARWEIYPNPSQGNFIIAFQGQNLAEDLLIFDALGRPIPFDVKPLSDQLLGINLHQASSGVYFLKVKTAGVWKMERILVE
jgi:hypothetical protein